MDSYIHIGKSYLEHLPADDTQEAQTRLCSRIRIGNHETVLWFGVGAEQETALSIGRADAFVMALLPAAMRQSLDIVCGDPMSLRLHHQLMHDLVPAITYNGDMFHMIRINAEVSSEKISSTGVTATGFSGGVDSLYSVCMHGSDSLFPVTHLAVFNSGVFEGKKYRLEFLKACKNCGRFADENGLETIYVDSNLYELLDENYIQVATYRLLACALSVQGMVSVYLLSSAFYITDFALTQDHAACYDPLTVSSACTETLQFYLFGVHVNRIEKLKALTHWPPAHRWLHPCAYGESGAVNCGRCKKCMWDLAALYAFGELDQFRAVFNIDDYLKNLPQRLGFVLSYDQDPFCRDVVRLLRDKGTEIPPAAYNCAEMFRKARHLQESKS